MPQNDRIYVKCFTVIVACNQKCFFAVSMRCSIHLFTCASFLLVLENEEWLSGHFCWRPWGGAGPGAEGTRSPQRPPTEKIFLFCESISSGACVIVLWLKDSPQFRCVLHFFFGFQFRQGQDSTIDLLQGIGATPTEGVGIDPWYTWDLEFKDFVFDKIWQNPT